MLCSDGVTECAGKSKQQFGIERVMDCVCRGATRSLGDLMRFLEQELLTWRGSDEFDDDVSVLGIELHEGTGPDEKDRTDRPRV